MEHEILLEEESLEYEVYQKIAPATKTFLSAYLGERLLQLDPESYLKIETAIKNNIHYHACVIADILYNHRMIKDEDEWDKAFDNFKYDNSEIPWHDTQHWFERDFGSDADEDTFLEDAYSFELTEVQQQAKTIIETIDTLLTNNRNTAKFMQAGYKVLNSVVRQLLKDIAIFDLTILSTIGFIELQKKIDMMNEMILEDLAEIVPLSGSGL